MKIKRLVACLLLLCVFATILVGSTSALELAEGNHVKWCDRIKDLPAYASTFYDWLETQGALGINGALADPTKADMVFGYYVWEIPHTITKSVTFSYPENAGEEVRNAAANAALDAFLKGSEAKLVQSYIVETYHAFMQDHPEIFWLTGEEQILSAATTGSYVPGKTESTISANAHFYFLLKALRETK